MGNLHNKQVIPTEDVNTGVNFNKDELLILYRNFKKLDKNGNGQLDLEEFFDVPELSDNPIVQRITKAFDVNGDEKISFYEFVSGLNILTMEGNLDDKFKLAFKIYDVDGNGYISNGDLFKSLKLFISDELDDVQIQQLVDRTMLYADLDKDGGISFEEFVAYVKNMNIKEMFSMDLFKNQHGIK